MNTTNDPKEVGNTVCPTADNLPEKTKTKAGLVFLVLLVASLAGAANVPSGIAGLWRFQNSTDKLKATIGTDLVNSDPANASAWLGPWTDIGVESWHTKYSDGGIIQDQAYYYLTVYHGIGAEGIGAGTYINKYTIAVDFFAGANWNSLYQTAFNGIANDGDLWVDATTATNAVIGVTGIGYSAATFNATNWHRIVWSVDNGNFFRVYVDGTLFLDGAGQAIDGRWSLELDRFHLFADDNYEDAWCFAGTVAVWNRPLTDVEIAGMGGWIGGAATPTPLIFSEATTNTSPLITSVSPANGETNVAPNFAYQATILDSSTATVDQNTIQLLLDGIPVTPIVASSFGFVTVNFSGGGLLQGGSTHNYTLTFDTTGVSSSITNKVTFQVQNYSCYEWRFTSGDLTTDLGNGTMSYVAGDAGTMFGTTDGSTVPHIGGSPAKYMHVPGFTSDTDGYWLVFNDSGPNVGTNSHINRYTLAFDALLPDLNAVNDPDYIVPFFNTDPYNVSDADFYLRTSGSIGIGGGGYSAANAITSNAWFRLAFVADLKANTLNYYVNGINVKSRTADGLGGRWALFSNQDIGAFPLEPACLLLFNEGDTSGIYTHELYVSSVAFTDRALTADEASALGGPSADGILVRSFSPKPAMAVQRTGNSAVVSWPAYYVGYALEQADNLASPQWKPVSGITNNAVNLPIGTQSQFFRLVQ